MWEKEKLLVTSNFSFSHIVFKRLVLQTRKNKGLFGKRLWVTSWIFFNANSPFTISKTEFSMVLDNYTHLYLGFSRRAFRLRDPLYFWLGRKLNGYRKKSPFPMMFYKGFSWQLIWKASFLVFLSLRKVFEHICTSRAQKHVVIMGNKSYWRILNIKSNGSVASDVCTSLSLWYPTNLS